jgi:hypothetical protein
MARITGKQLATHLQLTGSLSISGSLYGDGSNLTGIGVPAGTISSSAQVISSLPAGTISGSSQLPSGIISGSTQLSYGIISSSAQFDTLTLPFTGSFTGSFIGDGSSLTLLPAQTENDFTTALKNKLDAIEASADVTDAANVLANLPNGVISGSSQLPSGLVSGSTQLPLGLISGSAQVIAHLPAGTISGSIQVSHDDTTGFVANEHIDWTTDQGATNIHPGNYTDTNTTYSITDGELSENNFTTTLKNKLDAIEASADVTDATNVLANLPAGIISGSAQISITESQISDLGLYLTSVPAGTISGSSQMLTNLVGSDLVVKTITAEEYVVSSSVTHMTTSFSSGSTIFGDDILDTHQFTGSLYVSGSLYGDGSNLTGVGGAAGTISSSAQLPSGIISSSTQFDTLTLPFTGSFTGSFAGDGSGIISLPSQTENDFTTTLKNKLDAIEASADVTDAANVLANLPSGTISGSAQLPSGIISGSTQFDTLTFPFTGSFTGSFVGDGTGITGISGASDENFTTTLKNKLDAIEASADVTDAANVLANLPSGVISGSTQFDTITLPFTGSFTGSFAGDGSGITGISGASDENFTTALKNKLDGIEASADVTDAANVLANLPSGVISGSAQVDYTSISNVSSGIISGSSQFNTLTLPFTGSFTGSFKGDGSALISLPTQTENDFTTTLKNKLDAIEAAADVTDATNVLANLPSGIISGSTQLPANIISSSAQLPSGIISGSTQFDTLTLPFTGSFTGSFVGDGSGITGISGASDENFTTTLKNKLDGIEALADVTDAANVLANLPNGIISGSTQLPSGIISGSAQVIAQLPAGIISGSTQFDTLTLPFTGSFTGSFVGDGSLLTSLPAQTANDFTTTLKNKLDGIELLADVTDATNVAAAGALMDSELATIALVKALTPTMISGSFTSLSSSIASDVATNTAKVTNVSTNLSKTVSGTGFSINSSDGDNVALSLADTDNWGLMSDEMFDKLDGIEALADVTDTTNVLASLPSGVVSSSAQIDHDSTTNFVANEHIDWTTDQGATNIHSGNYTDTNTTYSVGDGGLSEINFTSADNSKLDGIEALADVTDAANVLANLPAGIISGSAQLPSGLISGSTQLPNGIISGSTQLPSGLISGSIQFNTLTLPFTGSFTGSFVGDGSLLTSLPSQTENDFTTTLKNKLDAIEASADVTDAANVLANLPANIISSSAQVDHDSTTNFVANEHIDWTTDQGATNIHSGNYTDTNTTYSVTDGELSENNFTTTLKNKLDAIEASADVTDAANVLANLPANIISSSAQFDTITLPFTGSFTGSFQGTAELIQGDVKISGGSLGVGVNANETDGRIDASNDIVAYSSSDKRWKTNIKIIESPLEKLQKLSGVEFDWIEDSKLHGNSGNDVGVIAQEVELVLPQAVQTRDTGMKAVRYEKIIPLLIETIKEQQKQIDDLKNKIG